MCSKILDDLSFGCSDLKNWMFRMKNVLLNFIILPEVKTVKYFCLFKGYSRRKLVQLPSNVSTTTIPPIRLELLRNVIVVELEQSCLGMKIIVLNFYNRNSK